MIFSEDGGLLKYEYCWIILPLNLPLIPPKMTKLGNATRALLRGLQSHVAFFASRFPFLDVSRQGPNVPATVLRHFLNFPPEPCLAVRIWHAMQLQLHLSPCALQPRVVGQPPSGCGKLWLNQQLMCLTIRKEELLCCYSGMQENLSKWEVIQSFLTFNTCKDSWQWENG